MEEGNFIDGKQEGLCKGYYENGQLKLERYYKNGKKEGLEKNYDENGQLKLEIYYLDDKSYNMMRLYYDNGQVKEERNWKGIKLISKKCWDEKGKEIECK